MRILCLTSRLPYPPDRGDRLRAYHFLKSLSNHHELHLLSFIEDQSELTHLELLKSIFKDVKVVRMSKLRSLTSVGIKFWQPYPLQALYYQSSVMNRTIQEALTSYDFQAAYIHLFRMAPYLEEAKEIYRIVDLTDVISKEISMSLKYRSIPSRLLYTIEKKRIQDYEKRLCTNFDEVWLISDSDRQILVGNCNNDNIQVVPNGIDTHKFHPINITPVPHSIIFTGHFGVTHNIDAAIVLVSKILPIIHKVFPDCTLNLVGASPSKAILKLGEIHGVKVTGYVEDLNQYLNQATIFVAPLRFAAGIQNKVLEAMAAARPVITTSVVNEGLKAIDGSELIIADDPHDMAKSILKLFETPLEASKIGESARRFVSTRFSWNAVLQRVDKIEEDLTS